MSPATIIAIAVPVLVVLAGVLLFASARRRDTDEATGVLSSETARRDRGPVELTEADHRASGREVERAAVLARREAATPARVEVAEPPVAWVPPDAETLGITRRQFFNRSIVTTFALGLSGFGAASLAFLWPSGTGGFGSQVNVGSLDDIKANIDENDGFAYYPEGRMWITRFPEEALEKARAVYSPPELAGMEEGVIALWQKCPHLGCRVPACISSKWFECGCHGSQYNQVGEKKGGPAPRGMDRFAMTVANGQLTVDTGQAGQIQGPPIGTNTTGQEAEGPHCVGGTTH
jgi:cytochrome b6-f complex iron-sulfur subunit